MAKKPPVLVTGAPGWLGNRLLKTLLNPSKDLPANGKIASFGDIRCLALPDAPAEELRKTFTEVEVHTGDVRDSAAVGAFCADATGGTLFHLAGLIHPSRVRELYEVNYRGTQNLIAAAAAAGMKRIVAVSSNSPAGVSKDPTTLFNESSPYRPYLNYGMSKKLMEDALNDAHRRGIIETTILRPCWFYGPDQPPRQTLFFKMIKEGKAPIVGSGDAKRSMSYVDNTVQGLLLAATSDKAAGETYWVADTRPYSMNEIVDTIEDVLATDFGLPVARKRSRLPSVASEVAYMVDVVIQKTGRYQQKVHVLSEMNKTIACSIDKAQSELGYRPNIDLREGMRRSIQWCLDNGQEI